MRQKGTLPTAITYNGTISSCKKGLNPSTALEIFAEIKREKGPPIVVAFIDIVSTYKKGQ